MTVTLGRGPTVPPDNVRSVLHYQFKSHATSDELYKHKRSVWSPARVECTLIMASSKAYFSIANPRKFGNILLSITRTIFYKTILDSSVLQLIFL